MRDIEARIQGLRKSNLYQTTILLKDFNNIAMKYNESVKEFFDRVTTIINQIRSYGDIIEGKKFVEKILGIFFKLAEGGNSQGKIAKG